MPSTTRSNTIFINKNWKLNGVYYSNDSLKKKSLELISNPEEHLKETGRFLQHWIDENDSVILETSGSTGIQKSISVKKIHLINSAKATGKFFDIKPNQKALLCLNPKYIGGKMMLVRAITLGMSLDIVPPSLTPLDGITEVYDFCAMVPMQAAASISKLYLLKTLIVGGAEVSETLISKLKSAPNTIFETYGMTETLSHIAVRQITPSTSIHFTTMPKVLISSDKRGCLIIDAPNIGQNNLITNDLVRLVSKTCFEWLGRYDYLINSGGIKLIPENIEKKLQHLIPYRFFICGVPDPILGNKAVLIVECSAELGGTILSNIKTKSTLTRFEIPKAIYFAPSFKETASQKINRIDTMKELNLFH